MCKNADPIPIFGEIGDPVLILDFVLHVVILEKNIIYIINADGLRSSVIN